MPTLRRGVSVALERWPERKLKAGMATSAPAQRMEAQNMDVASPKTQHPTPTNGPPPDAAPFAYFAAILKDSPHGTSNATTRFQATHFWWSDPTPRQLTGYDPDLAAAARSAEAATALLSSL